MQEQLRQMKTQLTEELGRVLAFWEERALDRERGIFWTLGCDNKRLADGRRSTVLAARALWAYSAGYRFSGHKKYLEIAEIAYGDLMGHYADKALGGVYNDLDADGSVRVDSKVVYAQSYAVYGLSEYYLASGDKGALEAAKAIYALIEKYSWDEAAGGYRTAFTRAWEPDSEGFTMDTHLHLMEAYTNLHKAWPDEGLRQRLKTIVDIMTGKFLREGGALYQSLTGDWAPTADTSDRYGDEGECCWMLTEAAGRIGEAAYTEKVRDAVSRMSHNILSVGLDTEHGGVYDRLNSDGGMSTDKLWWEESECVIALLYAWRMLGDEAAARGALNIWDFMRRYICTPTEEWNWKVRADGTPIPVPEQAPLKCPYHSSRITVLGVPVLREMLG